MPDSRPVARRSADSRPSSFLPLGCAALPPRAPDARPLWIPSRPRPAARQVGKRRRCAVRKHVGDSGDGGGGVSGDALAALRPQRGHTAGPGGGRMGLVALSAAERAAPPAAVVGACFGAAVGADDDGSQVCAGLRGCGPVTDAAAVSMPRELD